MDGEVLGKTTTLDTTREKTTYKIVKRLFDFILALIGCLFLLPIMIIVKVIYVFSKDRGPMIFTQNRIGKNGKIFKLYKFRSMVINADEILSEILKTNSNEAEEYRKNKKFSNDPRVTKIGKILRKTSIDELPQLINILKGDMSFIGPRPYLEREIVDMKGYYDYVISSKPGLTGLWQVSGRSEKSFDERLLLDKEYYEKKSLRLDTKIFFKTFYVVIKKEGAK